MIASPCGHGAAARQCVPVHSVSFRVFAQSAALSEQFVLRLELSPTASASFTIAFIAAICVNPEEPKFRHRRSHIHRKSSNIEDESRECRIVRNIALVLRCDLSYRTRISCIRVLVKPEVVISVLQVVRKTVSFDCTGNLPMRSVHQMWPGCLHKGHISGVQIDLIAAGGTHYALRRTQACQYNAPEHDGTDWKEACARARVQYKNASRVRHHPPSCALVHRSSYPAA